MNDEELTLETFIEGTLGFISVITAIIITLKVMSLILSPTPEYKSTYTTKTQPTTKAEVVQTVNNSIKEHNQKIAETKEIARTGKTKLTVRAELSEGNNIKEARLEFLLDSITNKDIDFAHEAMYGIVTKMQ
jgi:uncharacterized membrane protein YhiD involved in acid resistance